MGGPRKDGIDERLRRILADADDDMRRVRTSAAISLGLHILLATACLALGSQIVLPTSPAFGLVIGSAVTLSAIAAACVSLGLRRRRRRDAPSVALDALSTAQIRYAAAILLISAACVAISLRDLTPA